MGLGVPCVPECSKVFHVFQSVPEWNGGTLILLPSLRGVKRRSNLYNAINILSLLYYYLPLSIELQIASTFIILIFYRKKDFAMTM